MTKHELKCIRPFFADVLALRKTFEIRRNDRNFEIGDLLWLREYDVYREELTGRSCRRIVTYMTSFQQQEGYVVLGIEPEDAIKIPFRG